MDDRICSTEIRPLRVRSKNDLFFAVRYPRKILAYLAEFLNLRFKFDYGFGREFNGMFYFV